MNTAELRAPPGFLPSVDACQSAPAPQAGAPTEAFCMCDVATGEVLFCNPAGARLWGRSGAAWRESAEAWLAAVHPDDQARVRQALSPDGPLATADEEYRVIHPDGGIRWMRDRVFQAEDCPGRVCRRLRLIEDITAPKRAELRGVAIGVLGQRLSVASTVEEAARALAGAAAELIGWEACSVGVVSPEHTGLAPIFAAQVVHGQRQDCAPSALRPDPTALMLAAQDKGAQLLRWADWGEAAPRVREFPDGRPPLMPADMLAVPLRHATHVVGVIALVDSGARAYGAEALETLQALADYSAGAVGRIHTREILRQTDEQFRAMFQFSPLAMAIHAPGGKLLHANPAYQRMLDYSHDELCQLGVRRLTHPDDVAEGQRLHRDLLEGRREHYQREKRYVRRDGAVVWAQSTALAVRDGRGQLRYILSMVEDLTERRELTEEVLTIREKEQQRLGQDLHDGLCQNLIGLKFKSSLLARKLEERSLPEAGEARSFVRALEQAIQLGYDLSRGLQPVLLVREGLVCALEELASSTGALFNVACRFRACGAGKIQSQTVVTHLYRLAQEAVANAIKHSHGSRVRVLLVEGKKQVFLCVSDNGTGFAVGRRGGLGLSIMQHRARVIGASLQIRPRPGGGTRVVCILPKSAAHATGAKS